MVANKTNIVELTPPPREPPSPPLTNGSSATTEPSRNASPTSDFAPQLNSAADKESEETSVSLLPSSTYSSSSLDSVKKCSKFRRVAPRPSVGRPSFPPSPLRPPEHSRAPSASSVISHHGLPSVVRSPVLHTRETSVGSEERRSNGPNPLSDSAFRQCAEVTPKLTQHVVASSRGSSQVSTPQPSEPTTRIPITPIATPVTSPYISTSSLSRGVSHSSAPYRPGFQPRGVFRIRTDEFAVARKAKCDVGRIERTKLERRLEKLINLHFPIDGAGPSGLKSTVQPRRASSLFDLDISTIKNLDPTDLWKGVLNSQALQGPKAETRGKYFFMREPHDSHFIIAAEQRITPWQEDGTVSRCPLCKYVAALFALYQC